MLLFSFFESLKMGMIIAKLGIIDYILIVLLFIGSMIGYARGLSHQFPRFFISAVAVITTMHYYERISTLVTQHSSISPVIAQLVSFAVLVICSFVAMQFLLRAISVLGTFQCTYFLDRIGGAVIGAGRMVLYFSLFSFFINILAIPIVTQLYQEQALAGKAILSLCGVVHTYAMYILTAIVTGIKQTPTA